MLTPGLVSPSDQHMCLLPTYSPHPEVSKSSFHLPFSSPCSSILNYLDKESDCPENQYNQDSYNLLTENPTDLSANTHPE